MLANAIATLVIMPLNGNPFLSFIPSLAGNAFPNAQCCQMMGKAQYATPYV
ncbi:MAG TPA: hypothetical protein V6D07_11980 [Trichocoleus sp.]